MKLFPMLLSLTLLFQLPLAISAQEEEPVQETSESGTQDSSDQKKTDQEGTEKTQLDWDQLNLLSYEVLDKEGNRVRTWYPDETYDLALYYIDYNMQTSTLIPDAQNMKDQTITQIQTDHLSDGFSGDQKATVTLLSDPDQPLRFKILYEGLTWNGEENIFRSTIGFPGLSSQFVKEETVIAACRAKPEETQPESSWSGSYSEPVVIPSATPHIIVEKYSWGKNPILSGQTFELSLTFTNTSKTVNLENILMSLQVQDGLSITDSSNTFYFDSLPAGGEKTKKIQMKALAMDKTSSPSVDVNFTYEYVDGSQRMEKSSSEIIAIPVSQPDRFEISEPVLTETAFAGEEYVLSLPYVNKGKGILYNVTVQVDGDIDTLAPVQNLGNLEAGRSGSMDVVVIPAESGQYSFKVVITYENEAGEEIVQEFPVELNVEQAPVMDDPALDEPAEEEHSSLGWIWIGLLVAAAAGIFLLIRRRKKKKAASSQDETDYFMDDDHADE